jgi:hypothetical protein
MLRLPHTFCLSSTLEDPVPQTDPFHSLQPGRKLSDVELASAIRLNLEAELDAINLYAAHIEATDNAEAKAILRHVMDEEREHAALFTQLLHRLDPEMKKHNDEASVKFRLVVSGASHEEVEAVSEGKNGPPPPELPMKNLTIGSLFKQR